MTTSQAEQQETEPRSKKNTVQAPNQTSKEAVFQKNAKAFFQKTARSQRKKGLGEREARSWLASLKPHARTGMEN